MEWLIENWQEFLAGISLVLTGLAALAKLTPTPKDDKLVAKALNFLNLLPKKR